MPSSRKPVPVAQFSSEQLEEIPGIDADLAEKNVQGK
jgi:hypothetical protein